MRGNVGWRNGAVLILTAGTAVRMRQPGQMRAPAAEKPVAEVQQRPGQAPRQRGCPGPQARCPPTPERGVQAGDPGAIVKPGMQQGRHLRTRESDRAGIERFSTDVHELKAIGHGSRTQKLDFAGAQRAFTVEEEGQRPMRFLVHQLCLCIGFRHGRRKCPGLQPAIGCASGWPRQGRFHTCQPCR